ncbi:hypothetical protein AAHA92_29505 [Salvia divinorum]|uniref:Pectinesterase inhibitor domain-containing protein n=1 Tax=Salvia divinorum TaxID=28513 RepID=A0ABD1G191_SALDI
MDAASEPLREDKLASIRRRNKILIATFFSLIILLALITGGTITSFVHKLNSESIRSNRAVIEFCSPFEFQSACVDSISSETNPSPDANPNQIFILSLQSSLTKISEIIPITRSDRALSSCSSSLSHAAAQLSNILETLGIDPDLESYDRGNMKVWIGAAVGGLAACAEADSEMGKMVADVAAVVRYGEYFLANCDVVNSQFRWSRRYSRNWINEVPENLITVSLFGLQYLALIFLFCLLLRIYEKK